MLKIDEKSSPTGGFKYDRPIKIMTIHGSGLLFWAIYVPPCLSYMHY